MRTTTPGRALATMMLRWLVYYGTGGLARGQRALVRNAASTSDNSLFKGLPMIPFLFRLTLITLLVVRSVPGGQGPTEPSRADTDFEAYKAAQQEMPENPVEDMSERELSVWGEAYGLNLRKLGLAFIEKHPTDPRRWVVVSEFSPDFPRFVTDWRDVTNAVVDTNAVARWAAKVTELQSAMAKAGDVPADIRERDSEAMALKPFHEAMEAAERGEKVDVAGLRKELESYAAKHPQSDAAKYMLIYLSAAFEQGDPADLAKDWEAFAQSPNRHVAEFAKQKLAFLERIRKPLEIAFAAVDGRAVDLKKLRGKVVLLDFWATWCQPCVAELPKILKMYETYHDQGLEVVGISLEMASLSPQDSPDQRASKLSKAKNRLVQFIEKRKMPWPQYFDGMGWENEIAKDYALSGIPTLFLLNKDGSIVSINPRGDALESEIQRLLRP